MNATVKDLAVFIGHKLHPRELSQIALADLEDAYGRLSTTHPEKLLDLVLAFSRSGMHPMRPVVERVLGKDRQERNPALGVRFRK